MHAFIHKKKEMANSLGSSSMLLSLSLLLFTFFVISPSFANLDRIKASDNVVEEVCRYTQDPDYCATALKSHPEAAKADIPGLAQIAVDLAYKVANDSDTYVMSLIRSGISPELQPRYLLCSESIIEVMEEIQDAREELRSKDYIDVSSAALDAIEEAQDCQDEFKMPPVEPSQLPQMIKNLVTLSSAIFFIAGRLIV